MAGDRACHSAGSGPASHAGARGRKGLPEMVDGPWQRAEKSNVSRTVSSGMWTSTYKAGGA